MKSSKLASKAAADSLNSTEDRMDAERHSSEQHQVSIAELARNIASCREQLRHLIAVAAYHRAERRGFAPGHEHEDWLAAEEEIMG